MFKQRPCAYYDISQTISKVDKSVHGWGLQANNLLCVALYQGLDIYGKYKEALLC